MAGSSGAILSKMVKAMHHERDDPIDPIIDEYLMVRGRAENRLNHHPINMKEDMRPGGRISPSSVCGCERAAVFKFAGVVARRKTDPDKELIFETGKWIHHMWQALFMDMALVLPHRIRVVGYEVRSQIDELYVAGALDLQIEIWDEEFEEWVPIVIDVKSINSYGYNYVMQQAAPVASHVQQIITYCKARGIPTAYLLYQNKNDSRRQGFMIEVENENWNEVIEWCETVVDHLENVVVPPKDSDCHKGTFTFERCPYSWICFGKKGKSDEQLVKLTYKKGWKGVDKAWKQGLRAIDDHEARLEEERKASSGSK